MNETKELRTFVISHKGKIISPVLTTTREYGRWMLLTFDGYTCEKELHLYSSKDGLMTTEWHPGTKIGVWFDSHEFTDPKYTSWFFEKNYSVVAKLVQMKLAELRDTVPISVSDELHRYMLRCYSLDQLQLYIQSNLDKQFKIEGKTLKPREIKVKDIDFSHMIIPEKQKGRRSLFEQKKPIQVTMADIEEKFGGPVSIVS